MFPLEQRVKAVKLYIQYDLRYAPVYHELGYPKNKSTLKAWYKEYMSTGGLHSKSTRTPKYTKEQRKVAVDHFLQHGRCYSHTMKTLGYPSRTQLKAWVEEEAPDAASHYCKKSSSLVHLNPEDKKQAVIDLCSRNGSAKDVADQYGVSRYSLYNWKKQLLSDEVPASMTKKTMKDKPLSRQVEDLQTENEELCKKVEDLRHEYEELQKQTYRLRLEKDVLEKAAEILKKDQGVSLNTLTNREKSMVIDALNDRYSIKELLSVFKMAKSSYYYQESRLKAPDKYSDLREEIRKVFSESGCCYGYRRIYLGLKNNGTTVSEKVVRRIMREEGLVVPLKKQRKYSSYKGEISPAVPNVIDRDFHADNPNEKWLTDITEFHIPAGRIYLSPIIDCFDGLPVCWTIGTSPDAELVNSMLDAAIQTLGDNEHPIVHSDRGCHYRWPGWIERMDAAGLTRSMSKKGCSPDNSACEGFFGRLKNEMFYGRNWQDISTEEFIEHLDRYMHWYAEERIKVSLGGLSPMNYRRSLGLVA